MQNQAPPRPPSVEAVLSWLRPSLEAGTDPAAVSTLVRAVVADERERLRTGERPRSAEALADAAHHRLAALVAPAGAGLVPVINATGVIVHTNLGRSSWPQSAIDAAGRAAAEPVLLELDRESGRRGRRYHVAEEHLSSLTGAEDALVTNNNAAALALAVGLARRRGVLVSRGELVEIGGGVRIPEIDSPRRRPPRRGRDHQPYAGRGLRGSPRRRTRCHDPAGPPIQLPPGRLRRDAGPRGAGRPGASPRCPARGRPWLRCDRSTPRPSG